MSIGSQIAKRISEQRIDTAGSLLGRLPATGARERRTSRERGDLLQTYSSNGWVRLPVGTVARRKAAAKLTLMAPKTRSRAKDLAVKARVMAEPPGAARQGLIKAMQATGDLVDVEETWGPHPFLEMMRRGVPGYFDGFQAAELEEQCLQLVGEAVFVILRDKSGIPYIRLPIPPHWLTVPTQPGVPYQISYLAQAVPWEDLDFQRVPDPFNPYGRGAGTVGALDHEIAIAEETNATLLTTFRNRVRPDILVAGTFTSREGQALKDRFQEELRGSYNAGSAFFLEMPEGPENKIQVHDLGKSPADMEAVELTQSLRDTIVQVCRVPPGSLGIHENSNRASAIVDEETLRNNSTVPSVEAWVRWLQARYLDSYRGRPAEFGGESRMILTYQLPEVQDVERRDKIMKDHPAAFSLNEFRQEAGLPVDPDLDGLREVPTGVMVTDTLVTEPYEPTPPEPKSEEEDRKEEKDAGHVHPFLPQGVDYPAFMELEPRPRVRKL